jgi:hypothetical protein
MEYYINSFQEFIKDLCRRHVDLAHDDMTNVSFVRFQSNDDLNQVQNNGAQNIVLVARYYGRSFGQNADDMRMKQFVQLRFAAAAIPDPVINYSDVIAAAADKAFTIMMDFISRMQQVQHDDDCGPLRGIELENANWGEIPDQPFLVQHYGWDLTLPFNSDFPAYDAAKWTALDVPE